MHDRDPAGHARIPPTASRSATCCGPGGHASASVPATSPRRKSRHHRDRRRPGRAVRRLSSEAARDRDVVILDGAPSGSATSGATAGTRCGSSRRPSSTGSTGFPSRPRGDHFPTKDEMADYLERYAGAVRPAPAARQPRRAAARRGRPLRRGDRRRTVRARRRSSSPRRDTGSRRSRRWRRACRADVFQMHSSDYRRPAQVPPARVLLVGAGNSGAEIAMDLAPTHEVVLAGARRAHPLRHLRLHGPQAAGPPGDPRPVPPHC